MQFPISIVAISWVEEKKMDMNFLKLIGVIAVLNMASTTSALVWFRGKVKAVPSGDSLLIMASIKTELPPEKTITLAHLIAPKLVIFFS